ncbi:MAG: hypothetical protein Fur0018_02980 [Anaerolineales bacterium]
MKLILAQIGLRSGGLCVHRTRSDIVICSQHLKGLTVNEAAGGVSAFYKNLQTFP